MPASENVVRDAVVSHIAGEGYTDNMRINSGGQHGVDIYAEHRDSATRRIFIEAKGHSNRGNKTLAIYIAWGQLLHRVTSINLNRIHGLAFPVEWEKNVAKLTSFLVASHLNVRFYFVTEKKHVTIFTSAQLRRKYDQ